MTGEEIEEPLPGSRLSDVVRVGDTVRRRRGSWTPAVTDLLAWLRHAGYPYAPEPLGTDDRGREVLRYIVGDTVGADLPWPDWVWGDDLLAEVGAATAELHRAVAGYAPPGEQTWRWAPAAVGAGELVCHNDIAPYNVVVRDGHLAGIIDWDLAYPTTAVSELAFVAWQWVPLQHPTISAYFGYAAAADPGRRLRLLLDAYGLPAGERAGFVDAVIERITLNRDVMAKKAEEGDVDYQALVEAGHIGGMNAALDHVRSIAPDLVAAIA